MDVTHDEVLLKPEAVAKILAVSKPYVYKMAATGLLSPVRWGEPAAGGKRAIVRFRREDVRRFIQEHYSGDIS